MIFKIEWTPGTAAHLQVLDDDRRVVQDVPKALSTGDVCRYLKRSRRHLYRYVRRGWLKPVVKFSGEFFFNSNDIEALKSKTGRAQSALPTSMAFLFPEYDANALHAKRDADLILSRILERGGEREVKWAIKNYRLALRRHFLREEGQRLLSARALRFWGWLWHVAPGRNKSQWRKAGLLFGGIS